MSASYHVSSHDGAFTTRLNSPPPEYDPLQDPHLRLYFSKPRNRRVVQAMHGVDAADGAEEDPRAGLRGRPGPGSGRGASAPYGGRARRGSAGSRPPRPRRSERQTPRAPGAAGAGAAAPATHRVRGFQTSGFITTMKRLWEALGIPPAERSYAYNVTLKHPTAADEYLTRLRRLLVYRKSFAALDAVRREIQASVQRALAEGRGSRRGLVRDLTQLPVVVTRMASLVNASRLACQRPVALPSLAVAAAPPRNFILSLLRESLYTRENTALFMAILRFGGDKTLAELQARVGAFFDGCRAQGDSDDHFDIRASRGAPQGAGDTAKEVPASAPAPGAEAVAVAEAETGLYFLLGMDSDAVFEDDALGRAWAEHLAGCRGAYTDDFDAGDVPLLTPLQTYEMAKCEQHLLEEFAAIDDSLTGDGLTVVTVPVLGVPGTLETYAAARHSVVLPRGQPLRETADGPARAAPGHPHGAPKLTMRSVQSQPGPRPRPRGASASSVHGGAAAAKVTRSQGPPPSERLTVLPELARSTRPAPAPASAAASATTVTVTTTTTTTAAEAAVRARARSRPIRALRAVHASPEAAAETGAGAGAEAERRREHVARPHAPVEKVRRPSVTKDNDAGMRGARKTTTVVVSERYADERLTLAERAPPVLVAETRHAPGPVAHAQERATLAAYADAMPPVAEAEAMDEPMTLADMLPSNDAAPCSVAITDYDIDGFDDDAEQECEPEHGHAAASEHSFPLDEQAPTVSTVTHVHEAEQEAVHDAECERLAEHAPEAETAAEDPGERGPPGSVAAAVDAPGAAVSLAAHGDEDLYGAEEFPDEDSEKHTDSIAEHVSADRSDSHEGAVPANTERPHFTAVAPASPEEPLTALQHESVKAIADAEGLGALPREGNPELLTTSLSPAVEEAGHPLVGEVSAEAEAGAPHDRDYDHAVDLDFEQPIMPGAEPDTEVSRSLDGHSFEAEPAHSALPAEAPDSGHPLSEESVRSRTASGDAAHANVNAHVHASDDDALSDHDHTKALNFEAEPLAEECVHHGGNGSHSRNDHSPGPAISTPDAAEEAYTEVFKSPDPDAESLPDVSPAARSEPDLSLGDNAYPLVSAGRPESDAHAHDDFIPGEVIDLGTEPDLSFDFGEPALATSAPRALEGTLAEVHVAEGRGV